MPTKNVFVNNGVAVRTTKQMISVNNRWIVKRW